MEEPSFASVQDGISRLSIDEYQYKVLEKNEIRLLELLPWKSSQNLHITEAQVPLHGRLLSVQLNALPQYEAVSYTWGKPIPDHTIRLYDRDDDQNQQKGLCV